MNQSFNDQLNSIQILEQLAPLQLAKEHLPGDIIDILERLGKADQIPHNQLYYIAENCANHYYSKVIETFVALLKWQFTDRQLLLVNTARSLKFLEEYAVIYVAPQRSWGDRSDTDHSKCLLLGGRRLNLLTVIPKPKGSGGARAATAQIGPANERNKTK